MNRKLIFFVVFAFVFEAVFALSACTTVSFQVEHPPIIDLRNVKTITVIPFEWSGAGRNEYLSRCATSALINGLRTGKIEYVDPQVLENNSVLNYWKYADVYITGRITNARTDRANETRQENYWNYFSNKQETATIRVTTITTTVEIEYSYIRSIDRAVLGTFRKSATDSRSYEQPGDRNGYRDLNRNQDWNQNRNPGRQEGARGYPQGRTTDTATAEAAIAKFSYTMDHELSPYTSDEKRNIRITTPPGDAKRITEANTYIRQDRYDEALALYSDIYKQTGAAGAAAVGYNTAILLAANKKYAEALDLLTNLNKKTEDSGKRTPSFIIKEIKKLQGFVDGLRILEAYRKNEVISGVNNPAVVSKAEPKAGSGQITGTANLNEAVVYALKESISSAEDPSVFTKMVAYANVNNGQWSMNIPDESPSSLWFILIDEGRYFYISKTPLNISSKIVLNTALMNKLETMSNEQ